MILWHHNVHDKRLAETLAYFQLSFVPVYRRERISKTILGLFQRCKITSFCIYEIYGLYDLMLRVWLPKEIGGGPFTKMLEEALDGLGCTRAIPFFRVRGRSSLELVVA